MSSYCSCLSGTEVFAAPFLNPSLEAWVFTVLLLSLSFYRLAARSYSSAFTSRRPCLHDPFSSDPLLLGAWVLTILSGPLSPLSLRCRITHIRPLSLCPVWSPGPHSRIFSQPRALRSRPKSLIPHTAPSPPQPGSSNTDHCGSGS